MTAQIVSNECTLAVEEMEAVNFNDTSHYRTPE